MEPYIKQKPNYVKLKITPTREELIQLINQQARALRKADDELEMYWSWIKDDHPEVADTLKYLKEMIHDGHWTWIEFINKFGREYE